jgi:hypothetical protein
VTAACKLSVKQLSGGADACCRRPAALAAALAACVFLVLPAHAQSQSELMVKAAYVFNLTKYVEWPSPSNRVVIGVVGGGPMVDTLRQLSGKMSDSREIVVVTDPSDAELKQCELVYITYSSGKKIDEVLAKLDGESVLTVGDAASFGHSGGMLTLLTVGDRVEIEVNLAACHHANLKISSKLLSLAKFVVTTGGAG